MSGWVVAAECLPGGWGDLALCGDRHREPLTFGRPQEHYCAAPYLHAPGTHRCSCGQEWWAGDEPEGVKRAYIARHADERPIRQEVVDAACVPGGVWHRVYLAVLGHPPLHVA